MSGSLITIFGLTLTLVGAVLLYFYGVPEKKIQDVTIFGPLALNLGNEPNKEWQERADEFFKRAKRLNRAGFALIVTGTLFQIVSVTIDQFSPS